MLASLIGLLPASAQDAHFFRISGPTATRIITLKPDGAMLWSNALSATNITFQASSNLSSTSNWVDYLMVTNTGGINSNRLFDPHPPANMALIPAGVFNMGDSLDSDTFAVPVHTVYVSAFYLDQFHVTKALWDTVSQWALAHGYDFHAGAGAPAYNMARTDVPAIYVDWYDCVKWCNARSEREGKTPAYYKDAGHALVYRSGNADLQNAWVNWKAGYRLPTEAEWEKSARGGLNGQRYPWGNTITSSQANYGFADSGQLTPVDHYPPNGYRLYDMSGNVHQRCWDWDGAYSGTIQSDPQGPATGVNRITRGGSYFGDDYACRSAIRQNDGPTNNDEYVGFRTVLSAGP